MRHTAAYLLIAVAAAACGEDESEHIDSVEEPMVVCADGPMVKGIDVSYYQGNVDWSAVRDSGRVFAFARVNHGGFMDPEFDDNWAHMKANGFIRGAYQYFDPAGNALDQAQIMVDKLGKLGPGDLPAVVDVEETDGIPPATIATKLTKWMAAVAEGTGKKPIVYTGRYFWNTYVASNAFDKHPLWVANWFTDCPDLPNAWDDWVFWQFSDMGSVPGIGGAVDLDRFNGSLAALEAFSGKVYAAEPVSTPEPLTMAPGEKVTAEIVVANVGGKTWGAKVALGTSKPRERKSVFADESWIDEARVAAISGNVAPGDEFTFEVVLHAPDEPGTYTEHFNLVHEDLGWFSDPPQGGPGDGAIALSIEVLNASGSAPPPDNADPSQEIVAEEEAESSSCQVGQRPKGWSGAPASRAAFLAIAGIAALLRRRRESQS